LARDQRRLLFRITRSEHDDLVRHSTNQDITSSA
jgi:hypothetical protein